MDSGRRKLYTKVTPRRLFSGEDSESPPTPRRPLFEDESSSVAASLTPAAPLKPLALARTPTTPLARRLFEDDDDSATEASPSATPPPPAACPAASPSSSVTPRPVASRRMLFDGAAALPLNRPAPTTRIARRLFEDESSTTTFSSVAAVTPAEPRPLAYWRLVLDAAAAARPNPADFLPAAGTRQLLPVCWNKKAMANYYSNPAPMYFR